MLASFPSQHVELEQSQIRESPINSAQIHPALASSFLLPRRQALLIPVVPLDNLEHCLDRYRAEGGARDFIDLVENLSQSTPLVRAIPEPARIVVCRAELLEELDDVDSVVRRILPLNWYPPPAPRAERTRPARPSTFMTLAR